MYEHPGHAQFGIPPIIQTERATDRSPDDGWVETALGKIAHQTAAVAGEGGNKALMDRAELAWQRFFYPANDCFDATPAANKLPAVDLEVADCLRLCLAAMGRNVRSPDGGEVSIGALSQPAADAVGTGDGWQPITTMQIWDCGIVTDGKNAAMSQKAESDFGGFYFAVDPEDALEWEPTHWIEAPGDKSAPLSTPPRQPDDAVLRKIVSSLTNDGKNAANMLSINHDALVPLLKEATDLLASTKSPDADGGAK